MLTACSTSSGSTSKNDTKNSATSSQSVAKTDAQTVLDFMYKGNISGFSDVSSDSASSVKSYLLDHLEKKQIDAMLANGNIDTYKLVVDGSDYSAQEIVSDYAEAYYKQIASISDATVKSVSLSGDSAKITATLTPIAALSEANPIGSARTELLGGIDNDTIVRESGNKDVKTIQKLITLKLYGLYYGQMGKTAAKADKPVDITFTLKKEGSHFIADKDTMLKLAKDSRAQVYADGDSDDNSDIAESSNNGNV
ncbi:hypothetical protein FACS1894193_03640 [Bacilli bacterium]|nr:hypothetical protein FACS1894192_03270 [Bacilli bacterium]GHU40805.1 hypothetical protein FACS1894193_03640 [Bacilli bacterium]GHU45111.1 hypothetical protein FACS1894194_0070 [Bacilli bacterium]